MNISSITDRASYVVYTNVWKAEYKKHSNTIRSTKQQIVVLSRAGDAKAGYLQSLRNRLRVQATDMLADRAAAKQLARDSRAISERQAA
jgi:hypothetical protein